MFIYRVLMLTVVSSALTTPPSFVRRACSADFRHFRGPPTQPAAPLLVREPVDASFAASRARVSTPRAANGVS